jgi:hypothetical protein
MVLMEPLIFVTGLLLALALLMRWMPRVVQQMRLWSVTRTLIAAQPRQTEPTITIQSITILAKAPLNQGISQTNQDPQESRGATTH